jgi:hypothetical protein
MSPPNEWNVDETQVPGTVQLVDLDGRAGTLHAGKGKDIILVPTPSNDRNDPLNWSPGRKRLHLACLIVWVPVRYLDFLALLAATRSQKRHGSQANATITSFVFFNGMCLSVVYSLLVPLSTALNVTGMSSPDQCYICRQG